MYRNPVMDGHMDSFGTQQHQQQQRQRKGAVVGVGRLNTSTYYTLQCYRQVHNPSIFHLGSLACWDCPLLLCPRWAESSRAIIHGIAVYFWLVLRVTRYALCVAWCGGGWCVLRGGPFSCASSPAELWLLSNLSGRVFDGVRCTHHTKSTYTKGRSYRRTFWLSFHTFLRTSFFISIFFFFFHILECETFQIFFPLLNFQTLEMLPVFPAFPAFLAKKEEKSGKSCSIRTAL